MKYAQIPAPIACNIADVDRFRWNQEISNGNYPCAPPTPKGAVRMCDVDDITALRIYGRMVDRGISPKVGGAIACNLLDLLHKNPDIDRAVMVWDVFGDFLSWAPFDTYDFANEHWHPNPKQSPKANVVSVETYYLGTLRKFIRDTVEEYLLSDEINFARQWDHDDNGRLVRTGLTVDETQEHFELRSISGKKSKDAALRLKWLSEKHELARLIRIGREHAAKEPK